MIFLSTVLALLNRSNLCYTCYNHGVRGNISEDIKARWLGEFYHLTLEFDSNILLSFSVSNTTLKDDKNRVNFTIFIENIRNILNTTRQVFSVLRIPPSIINLKNIPGLLILHTPLPNFATI